MVTSKRFLLALLFWAATVTQLGAQTPPSNTTLVKGVGNVVDFYISNTYNTSVSVAPTGINGTSLIDGQGNSQQESGNRIAAIDTCANKGIGWYLPSSVEFALATAELKATGGTSNWESGISNLTSNYFLTSDMAPMNVGGIPTIGYPAQMRPAYPNYRTNQGSNANYYVLCAWRPGAPVIRSVTHGSRSGTGSVNISAYCPGAQIRWYSAQTGGAQLTGSPTVSGAAWATPSVSTTTIYWAEAYDPTSGQASARVAVEAAVVPATLTCPTGYTKCDNCGWSRETNSAVNVCYKIKKGRPYGDCTGNRLNSMDGWANQSSVLSLGCGLASAFNGEPSGAYLASQYEYGLWYKYKNIACDVTYRTALGTIVASGADIVGSSTSSTSNDAMTTSSSLSSFPESHTPNTYPGSWQNTACNGTPTNVSSGSSGWTYTLSNGTLSSSGWSRAVGLYYWRPQGASSVTVSPTQSVINLCSSGAPAVLTATPSTGAQVEWYSAISGGSPLFVGSPFNANGPSVANSTQVYYVQARNTTTNMVSVRVPVSLTYIPATLDSIERVTYGCGTGVAPTFSATTLSLKTTVDWYSAQAGGSPVSYGDTASTNRNSYGYTNYFTPPSNIACTSCTTTYWAQARNLVSGCVSPRQKAEYIVYAAGGHATRCPAGTPAGTIYCPGCGYDSASAAWVDAWTMQTTISGTVFNNTDIMTILGSSYMDQLDGRRVTNAAVAAKRAGTIMEHCTSKGTGWYIPAVGELEKYNGVFTEQYMASYAASSTFGTSGIGGVYKYNWGYTSNRNIYIYTGGGHASQVFTWTYPYTSKSYNNSNISGYNYSFSAGNVSGNNSGSRCFWRPVACNDPACILTSGVTKHNCTAQTVELYATTNSGSTIKWYNVPTGGTAIATGTSFTTPVLSTSGATYYVEATKGAYTSTRTPIVIPTNATNIPVLNRIESPTYGCGAGVAPTFSATALAAGVTVDWYSTQTGGALIAAGDVNSSNRNSYGYTNYYTAPNITCTNCTTTYWAQARNIKSGCVSERQRADYIVYSVGGNTTRCPAGTPAGTIYCPGCGYEGQSGTWVDAWTAQATESGTVFGPNNDLLTTVGSDYMTQLDGKRVTDRAVAVNRAGSIMTHCTSKGTGWYVPAIAEWDRYSTAFPEQLTRSYAATSTFGTQGVGGYYKNNFGYSSNVTQYIYTGGGHSAPATTWNYPNGTTSYSNSAQGGANTWTWNSFIEGTIAGNNSGSRCWWRPTSAAPARITAYSISAYNCSAQTATLTATANSGSTINWYSAATGGNSLATGATFTTPVVPSGTGATYYVEAQNGSNYSARIPIVIPANAVNIPIINHIESTTYGCGAGVVPTFSATTLTVKATIDWYSTQTGGTPISYGDTASSNRNTYGYTNNYSAPTITCTNCTTTYWAQARNIASGCVSDRKRADYIVYAVGGNTTRCPAGTPTGTIYCSGCGYDSTGGSWVDAWTMQATTSGTVFNNTDIMTRLGSAYMDMLDGRRVTLKATAASRAGTIMTHCTGKGSGWYIPAIGELDKYNAAFPEQYMTAWSATSTFGTSGIGGVYKYNYRLNGSREEYLYSGGGHTTATGWSYPYMPITYSNSNVSGYNYSFTSGTVNGNNSGSRCFWRPGQPKVMSTTPGCRSNTGTVTLTAVAAPGIQIRWYTAKTGGSPLTTGSPSTGITASGATWTTPSISTSTTYWAEAYDPSSSTANPERVAVEALITVNCGRTSCPTGYTACTNCAWSDALNTMVDACYKVKVGRPYENYSGNVTNSKDGSVVQGSIVSGGGVLGAAFSGEPSDAYLASQYEYGLWYRSLGFSCGTSYQTTMGATGDVLGASVRNRNDAVAGSSVSLADYPNSHSPNSYTSWQNDGCNGRIPALNSGETGWSWTLSSGGLSSGSIANATGLYYVKINTPASATITPAKTAYYTCSPGQTVALSATASSGAQVEWYAAANGGSPIYVGSPYNVSVPTANNTTANYYVQARNTTTGITSARQLVTVGYLPATLDAIESQNYFCSTSTAYPATFAATSFTPYNTVDWYSAASGGTLVSKGDTVNTNRASYGYTNYYYVGNISATTTYYAEARNFLSGCKTPRQAATYTRYTVGGNSTYCPTGVPDGTQYCKGCGFDGTSGSWVDAWTVQATSGSTVFNNTDILETLGADYMTLFDGKRTTDRAIAKSRAGTLTTHCTGKGTGWYIPAVAELDRYNANFSEMLLNSYIATSTFGISGIGGGYKYNYGYTSNSNQYIYTGGGHTSTPAAWKYPYTTSYNNSNVSSYNYGFRVTSDNTGSRCWWRPGSTAAARIDSAKISTFNCANGTVTMTAYPNAGSSVSWYNVATGGTAVGTGTTFTTPAIPVEGMTYYVEAVNGSNVSARVPVLVQANIVPIAPIGPSSNLGNAFNFCSDIAANTLALSASVTNTALTTVDWYTSSTGGTAVSSGANTTATTYSYTIPTVISATTSYYAQSRNFYSGCTSTSRLLVATATKTGTGSVSVSFTAASQGGAAKALAVGSGGVEPYTYAWGNGSSTYGTTSIQSATGNIATAAGTGAQSVSFGTTYYVKAKDALGCISSQVSSSTGIHAAIPSAATYCANCGYNGNDWVDAWGILDNTSRSASTSFNSGSLNGTINSWNGRANWAVYGQVSFNVGPAANCRAKGASWYIAAPGEVWTWLNRGLNNDGIVIQGLASGCGTNAWAITWTSVNSLLSNENFTLSSAPQDTWHQFESQAMSRNSSGVFTNNGNCRTAGHVAASGGTDPYICLWRP